MAPRTSLAANNSTLACDTVEAKAKPLRLGFINIALVNDSERTLNLVEPPIYPQIITYRNPTMSSDLPPNVTPRADTTTRPNTTSTTGDSMQPSQLPATQETTPESPMRIMQCIEEQ
jgi:hypothetical protein